MAGKGDNEGLSVAYRIGYQLRRLGLTFFGPAQLGETSDPTAQLAAERAAKVARARREREQREAEDEARRRAF
ncbi:hypothetical protein [Intrasporangium sp.]|uniref:hypothetical protein n=1 Tax=Intrasporangium sp. TaxID=1925024 RepID=UPI00293ADE5B|nr:hypothetical protein [Intrasporangium sp.]MDV3220850.1 hypothetical protein [Intrasporangium sp.]